MATVQWEPGDVFRTKNSIFGVVIQTGEKTKALQIIIATDHGTKTHIEPLDQIPEEALPVFQPEIALDATSQLAVMGIRATLDILK